MTLLKSSSMFRHLLNIQSHSFNSETSSPPPSQIKEWAHSECRNNMRCAIHVRNERQNRLNMKCDPQKWNVRIQMDWKPFQANTFSKRRKWNPRSIRECSRTGLFRYCVTATPNPENSFHRTARTFVLFSPSFLYEPFTTVQKTRVEIKKLGGGTAFPHFELWYVLLPKVLPLSFRPHCKGKMFEVF
jgi:hypothetical protein